VLRAERAVAETVRHLWRTHDPAWKHLPEQVQLAAVDMIAADSILSAARRAYFEED